MPLNSPGEGNIILADFFVDHEVDIAFSCRVHIIYSEIKVAEVNGIAVPRAAKVKYVDIFIAGNAQQLLLGRNRDPSEIVVDSQPLSCIFAVFADDGGRLK